MSENDSMETWLEIRSEAARTPGVKVLSAEHAATIAARFAGAFVDDPENRWWWGALTDGARTDTHEYNDRDAWTLIREWLPERKSFVLLVTDEEPRPAGALQGSVDGLAMLVGACPYFEYVLTDDNGTFGIFDTHHNVLIRVGPLPL